MPELQDGAQLRVFYNGRSLDWITSIEMSTESGQQPIDVLRYGLAGFTPAAGRVTISLGYAVPRGGTEEEFQETCAKGEYVTFQIGQGSKDYIGRGKIMNNRVGQSTGANTEGSLEWMGPLKPLE